VAFSSNGQGAIQRAWYQAAIDSFLATSDQEVLGILAASGTHDLAIDQRNAWIAQFPILRDCLSGLSGTILLEYSIPRMGRRVDAILLIGPIVFVVEFKAGSDSFDQSAVEQVWDYALDLKNFHKASHTVSIVPILVATEAPDAIFSEFLPDYDNVYQPLQLSAGQLAGCIKRAIERIHGAALESLNWVNSPYHPTPTIIEAARALYSGHAVEEIARHDAGAENLAVTSNRVEELVDEARRLGRKTICFVTGVPGAGKTLVGLNVATQKRDERDETHAVFLSGNGPLVSVLREALTRDGVNRRRESGKKVRKGVVGAEVKAFIQNIHHFRDDALADSGPPSEHVVIFDEAQRAWNLVQTANFMKRKKGRPNFSMSEPEFLISCMDRHKDWAVIVCLVGGGQEINTGEAGIGEWLEALNRSFPHWHIHLSYELRDTEYATGHALQLIQGRAEAHLEEHLHLSVSMRSFRAEHVSSFVKALLDRSEEEGQSALNQFRSNYPVVITRDLQAAKGWIRAKARGSERYGLLSSSKAQRLKPHAIDIRVKTDPVHWFLNERDDTRSSYYLEDAATEFQVQGLELDWTCVTWDADMRFDQGDWHYHDFRGSRWINIKDESNQNYLRNAYRVLLTRARQGMVIFVPPGESDDPTRLPHFYDPTFEYLVNLGIERLEI
jgi:DUF2075 family protein